MDDVFAAPAALAGMAAGAALAVALDVFYSPTVRAERKVLPIRRLLLAVLLGVGWAAAAFVAEDLREFLLLVLFLTPLAVVTVTDFEARVIPNRVIYPAILLAFALSWAWPDRGPVEALIGAALGFGFLLFPFVLSGGGGIAAGDVKLALYIGAAAGWPAVLAGLLLGVLIGGVAAVVIGIRARSRSAAFAYGPYLAAGGAIALLVGEDIIDWYSG
ncbi:MAG: A24 family peptidase [Dehalococcoidia bacterium]